MSPEVALGKPYNGAADVYGEQQDALESDHICLLGLLSVGVNCLVKVVLTGWKLGWVLVSDLASLSACRDKRRHSAPCA